MALGTAGLVVLAQVDTSSGYGLLFPGYVLFGVSLGCVYAPMSTAAMTAMPQAKAGIAAGVLAMNRVLAGAITLAAAGAVFQAVLDDDLHAGQVEPEAFTSALSSATWLLVGLCAIGTVLTWAFVRSSDDDAVAPEHQARHHFHLPWVRAGPPGADGRVTSPGDDRYSDANHGSVSLRRRDVQRRRGARGPGRLPLHGLPAPDGQPVLGDRGSAPRCVQRRGQHARLVRDHGRGPR
jgi:hypothetical protein